MSDTKDKLKSLFEGRSEAEIDKAVLEMKMVLDQAAEEAKGDIDIGSEPDEFEPIVEPIVKASPIKKSPVPEQVVVHTGSDNVTKTIDCDKQTQTDPMRVFAEKLWDEKIREKEAYVYKTYEVAKQFKRLKRKQKWNAILSTIHFPKFRFKTHKEENTLNKALQEMFLHINYMDNESLEKLHSIITDARAKSLRDMDGMELPILYSKPL